MTDFVSADMKKAKAEIEESYLQKIIEDVEA